MFWFAVAYTAPILLLGLTLRIWGRSAGRTASPYLAAATIGGRPAPRPGEKPGLHRITLPPRLPIWRRPTYVDRPRPTPLDKPQAAGWVWTGEESPGVPS